MFKHLIKKVREESNSTILPTETDDDIESNSNAIQASPQVKRSTRGTNDSNDKKSTQQQRQRKVEVTTPSIHQLTSTKETTVKSSQEVEDEVATRNIHHDRTFSNTSSVLIDEQDEEQQQTQLLTVLSDLLSPYVRESVTAQSCLEILKSWIDLQLEACTKKDKIIGELSQQTIQLQTDLSNLRSQFKEIQLTAESKSLNTSTKLPLFQKQIDNLRSDNDSLKLNMKTLRSQMHDVEQERDDLLIKSTDLATECNYLRSNSSNKDELYSLRAQVEKKDQQVVQQDDELKRLRLLIEERDVLIDMFDKRLLNVHTQSVQTDEDTTFVNVLTTPANDEQSSSSITQEQIDSYQKAIEDKNRTIKTLQQRYNDLRKTLQREFGTSSSVPNDLNNVIPTTNTHYPHPLIHHDNSNETQSDHDQNSKVQRPVATTVRKNVTFSPVTTSSPAIISHTIESQHTAHKYKASTRNGQQQPPTSPTSSNGSINGTNFKYLKHVVLKFMTSTEDEAIHLIRAVSTLLSFSSDEERLLRETLDYKMSWFGRARPKMKLPSSATLS